MSSGEISVKEGPVLNFSHEALLPELFEVQVENAPEAVAISFEGQQLTYRELNNQSDRLAARLQNLGVMPEVKVVICMERSAELVVALLGVLKAGGVCVPVDPNAPRDHIDIVLTDTHAPIILTQEKFLSRFVDKDLHVLTLARTYKAQETNVWHSKATSENLAFIFYTSGSTGTPKGVMLSHRAIHSHTFWRKSYFNLTSSDRQLFKCPIGFAFLLTEVLTPLLTGGQIVIARAGGEQDTAYIVALIARNQVTIVNLIPSQIKAIVHEPNVGECATVRHCITGGEALPLRLQKEFYLHFDATLSIIYGTTEARSSTFWICDPNEDRDLLVIGTPAPNKRIYVLDEHLHPVPIGVAGELCVGGEGIARGYLNRPHLTSEKFILDPFSGDARARLYRTGDYARYLSDGTLEFLGRKDQQVKIGGFRIELHQVEAALAKHPGIREAAVITRATPAGDRQLVAYVAPASDEALTQMAIRIWLKNKIPDHMIPRIIRFLEALPRTSNGKIDLVALSESSTQNETIFVPPRNEQERSLAEIWQQVLGLDRVGIHANFFELGGDSLKAIKIISRVHERLHKNLPIKILFEKPTIAELSSAL